MIEATHKCSACLSKTIEDANQVDPPLVLAGPTCPNRPGIGHAWVETIGGAVRSEKKRKWWEWLWRENVEEVNKAATVTCFRVTGKIKESKSSKGYRSSIYKCAQDKHALYCEHGKMKSIFYDGDSRDLTINLLFENKENAYCFQDALYNFIFVHPTIGEKIEIEDIVQEINLFQLPERVLHKHYDPSENSDSPTLTLANLTSILSSDKVSVCHDPVKALQSLEDITCLPGTKYYWCHLVSAKDSKYTSKNNCIWGTWIFHQYFDALNLQSTGIPLIAVKFIRAENIPEDVPIGNDRFLTRRKVIVEIQFHSGEFGQAVAKAFQPFVKNGTTVKNPLLYESYFYPENATEMEFFLEQKYQQTMQDWQEDLNIEEIVEDNIV